ncbi:MAG: MerR family transcriptional regulator [Cytophagales bacterium]|nr:MerR family transcriptional regulator [Cytophagales bacterium]
MKRYYSMQEVERSLGINSSCLRFWEKEFSDVLPTVNLDKNGRRRFTARDIENFRQIYILLKKEKYTLAGAKQCLKENRYTQVLKREKDRERIEGHLNELKEFLLSIKGSIENEDSSSST